MNAPAPLGRLLAPSEADVIIVGGGPAGLSAATELKARGVSRVIVLERDETAGGVPRHCGHPPFGMREFHRVLTGPQYAARLVSCALAAGVEIHTRHSVVSIAPGGNVVASTPAGIRTLAARRVIVATGVHEAPRSARLISGERPLGILTTGALQAYVYLQHLLPFRRPVIVGTELVAFSAILTCLKAGARPVAMIEPGPHVVARAPLTLLPRLLGIPLQTGTEIADIAGGGRVEAVIIRGPDGAVRRLECDGVLLTGNFMPEASLLEGAGLALDPRSGGPVVDSYGRLSDPHIFAAGNLLRPVETAGWSWAEARRVAAAVAQDLKGALQKSDTFLRITAGEGVRFAVPQRVPPVRHGLALPRIQLRLTRRINGHLVVECDGRPIWSARLKSGPERRILVPLVKLAVPDHAQQITVKAVPAESVRLEQTYAHSRH